jgi:hypothetical protein
MVSRPPPDIQSLIAGWARALRTRDIGFMLIGGQAVLLHGARRLTDDIDVTLGIGPEKLFGSERAEGSGDETEASTILPITALSSPPN